MDDRPTPAVPPPGIGEATTARQSIARGVFALGVVLVAVWTLWTFLPALGWAGVIAIASWPFYKRMRERCPPSLRGAAFPALFTILIGLVFILPLVVFGWKMSQETQAAFAWIEEVRRNGVVMPEGLGALPYVGPMIGNWWRDNLADPQSAAALVKGLDRAAILSMGEHVGALAGRRLLIFAFTLLTLFFLFRDGDALALSLTRLAERWFGPRGRALGVQIVNSVHGTVDGLVLVGFGEGLVLTIAYYAAGVPQATLLGVATAIGAIIPFGAFVMFSIAALLLIYKGATIAALVIFALGLVVLTVADHVVRPIVIGSATQLPFIWVLIGILGGVETWGMLGLFLGPAIMAVLVDLWREAVRTSGRVEG